MQIPEDANPLPAEKGPRRAATIEELALRNSRQDDTLRLPLSAIALWREPENPELDTVRVRLDLPDDADEAVSLFVSVPD